MTTPDFDRRLDAFLDDGPARAPERTIEAALAHARAHPRRRDPLRAVRRDPMGTPWFGGSPVARGLVLVAVLGALLATSVAVAAIGGLFDRPAIVAPEPTPTTEPTPSAPPSSTAAIAVDLEERYGSDATIEVEDRSGGLASARSGRPADGGSVAAGVDVAVAADDPLTLVLTWTDLPCTTEHTLVIEEDGRTMTLTRPVCEGDTFPRDLQLELTFGEPVDPATIEVRSVAATQP
jgi:hypothetical protein